MSSNETPRDQHAERRVGEGIPPSWDGHERSESLDEETLGMLQECGLDLSTPVDPSSLKALQELCTPKRSHDKKTADELQEDSKQPAIPNGVMDEAKEQESNDPRGASIRSPHVPYEVLKPITFGRATSDLTTTLRSDAMMEEETDASTAGSTHVASTQKIILDQLQLQTALLMDLQRRVDELTQIVHQQQYRSGLPPPTFQQQPVFPPHLQQPRNVHPAEQQRRQPPRGDVHHDGGPPPPPPPQPPQMFIFSHLTQLYEALLSIPSVIRSSRMAKIWHVFWELHRRDMGNRIDGNLLLKILFVLLVITAKMTASSKRRKKGSTNIPFGVAAVLIFVGFLLQSGYYRFFHNFFIKERYPQRIWNGERIDVAAQQQQQQPPRPAEPRPNRAAVVPPQQGILRGHIPQANAQAGAAGRVVMDILYLLGSFLLSILPMWKAEPRQQQVEPEEENQRQPNEEQERDDNEG